MSPTLLVVAHGTRDPNGVAENGRLVALVRELLPGVSVELCWLERAEPLFADVLATTDGPVVVVPLLLSTGYHVKVDIGQIVADRPNTVVTRQLGPDTRITAAVAERLPAGADDVVLVASGSSDPEAAENLAEVARQLSELLGCPVLPRVLSQQGWTADVPRGSRVANYLLAPGYFNDELHRLAASEFDSAGVADPIGAHPAVAAVVLDRYREGLAETGLGR